MLIECVPNFSEGRNSDVIKQIIGSIESVDGVRLLNVDSGKATNRTVVTFVGHPDAVVEAAYRAIKKAADLIDMSKHRGEHPRMGATDVCPLIPINGISMEETAAYARILGERVGSELGISVFLYEAAATSPQRKNLADIRAGEYEGMEKKLLMPEWKPDFGPSELNKRAGVTAIGARDFLVAYNVNLNTTSVRRANSVAFDVREKGRVLREGDPRSGKIVTNENGEPVRVPGSCKSVKAIGWFIEEYGIAQISMNLTDINVTPLHIAFDECVKSAHKRGLRVTGSEIVGLVPKKVLLDAGRYFLKKQKLSHGVSEERLIHIAVKSLGLDELKPFDPKTRIIEYILEDIDKRLLVDLSLKAFAAETASESPAPGGGSVAAYVGSLGAALGTMVANLSANKGGYEDKFDYFVSYAVKGQDLKDRLLKLVDDDTAAFNAVMEALRLPKNTEVEKEIRSAAMDAATRQAIEVPLKVMRVALEIFDLAKAMVANGNPNSLSDAAVGSLCALTAVKGAYLNVLINCKGFLSREFVASTISEADAILEKSQIAALEIEKMAIYSLK